MCVRASLICHLCDALGAAIFSVPVYGVCARRFFCPCLNIASVPILIVCCVIVLVVSYVNSEVIYVLSCDVFYLCLKQLLLPYLSSVF